MAKVASNPVGYLHRGIGTPIQYSVLCVFKILHPNRTSSRSGGFAWQTDWLLHHATGSSVLSASVNFRLHWMHEMRTIAISDPVAWPPVRLSVCLSRERLFFLIPQTAPLRSGHYYITVESLSLPPAAKCIATCWSRIAIAARQC